MDDALFEGLDCIGIEVVFWDHEGCIIAALSQRVHLPQSIEMAEALAVRRAEVFAKELSLSVFELLKLWLPWVGVIHYLVR